MIGKQFEQFAFSDSEVSDISECIQPSSSFYRSQLEGANQLLDIRELPKANNDFGMLNDLSDNQNACLSPRSSLEHDCPSQYDKIQPGYPQESYNAFDSNIMMQFNISNHHFKNETPYSDKIQHSPFIFDENEIKNEQPQQIGFKQQDQHKKQSKRKKRQGQSKDSFMIKSSATTQAHCQSSALPKQSASTIPENSYSLSSKEINDKKDEKKKRKATPGKNEKGENLSDEQIILDLMNKNITKKISSIGNRRSDVTIKTIMRMMRTFYSLKLNQLTLYKKRYRKTHLRPHFINQCDYLVQDLFPQYTNSSLVSQEDLGDYLASLLFPKCLYLLKKKLQENNGQQDQSNNEESKELNKEQQKLKIREKKVFDIAEHTQNMLYNYNRQRVEEFLEIHQNLILTKYYLQKALSLLNGEGFKDAKEQVLARQQVNEVKKRSKKGKKKNQQKNNAVEDNDTQTSIFHMFYQDIEGLFQDCQKGLRRKSCCQSESSQDYSSESE